MSQRIAFFDFDGTITTKDTLLEFIKFRKGSLGFYSGFGLHLPWLVLMKTGVLGNQEVKERMLTWFFKNETLSSFQESCKAFSEKVIPSLVRPGAWSEFERLEKEGYQLVIVSASPDHWIEGFARQIRADLIATRLEIKDDKLTGRIQGRNCYGVEKVARIREKYDLAAYEHILAYGDSSGDLPMLDLAHQRNYKPFR